jgi:hypothetical protein
VVDIVFGATVVTKGRELDVVVVAAMGVVGGSIVNGTVWLPFKYRERSPVVLVVFSVRTIRL